MATRPGGERTATAVKPVRTVPENKPNSFLVLFANRCLFASPRQGEMLLIGLLGCADLCSSVFLMPDFEILLM